MTQSRTNTEVWDSLALDLVSIQVEGTIVFINAAGANMLGAATPEQLVGKPILDFVHPDYREIAAERVRQVTTKGIVVCPSEEMWLRLDGMAITVAVAAMPVFHEGQPAVQLMVREDKRGRPYWPARHWYSVSRSRRKRH
jgi:PAS domain S-box-containing protein